MRKKGATWAVTALKTAGFEISGRLQTDAGLRLISYAGFKQVTGRSQSWTFNTHAGEVSLSTLFISWQEPAY